ncbi:cellulose binding domain-containing protein, partial [Streptomyces griseorubens]|uniref:cellulose binding domain-containing protein n=1 Tax=Streptomyces griseorubens TaxID=66897 RepID=UPI003516A921
PEPDPEPQGTSSGAPAAPDDDAPAACVVDHDVLNQWAEGYQAAVTVTTRHALDGWRVAFTVPDGHRVTHMWDASVHQTGGRVTATAADYNAKVAAGARLSFGFLTARQGTDTRAYDFALNGRVCEVA